MQDPQDECVLCAYPLPLNVDESLYHSCCGEMICLGCIIGQKRVLGVGTNVEKPIKGSKEEAREFMLLSEQNCVCPFCRAEAPADDEEELERLWNRIDDFNDPTAMNMLGGYYLIGAIGLSKNLKKVEKLWKRSYDLGDPNAAAMLCVLYSDHIPNPILATKYLEEAARRGKSECMSHMAERAAQSGNWEEATRLYMMAARSGQDIAMKMLMVCYRGNMLSKDDLTTTLRAHKAANDAGKSEPREYALDFMRKTKKEQIKTRDGNFGLIAV